MNKLTRRKFIDTLQLVLLWLCGAIAVGFLLLILIYVLSRGIPNIHWAFLSTVYKPGLGSSGIREIIVGTLAMIGLTLLIAVPVGVYGALRQYSLGDRVVSFLAYLGLAIPNFFLALILMYLVLQVYFRTGVMVFPVSGMTSSGFEQFSFWQKVVDVAWHAVLPIVVLTTSDIAGFSRIMRGQMLEALSQDYVRTARAKGLPERVVVYKHALRNAIIPIVANIGGILPTLISGAGLVEVVTAWPGITPLLLDAISQQDLYVVAGFLTMGLVLLMIGNLLSDLLLAWVDPRIRYE